MRNLKREYKLERPDNALHSSGKSPADKQLKISAACVQLLSGGEMSCEHWKWFWYEIWNIRKKRTTFLS